MQNPGRIPPKGGTGWWCGGAATRPNILAARKFRAGPFLGRWSNASCLMQWEQVRHGLEFPDLGSQGTQGGGSSVAETA